MLLTRDGTVSIVIRLQAGQFGALIPVGARDNFFFSKMSRLFLGPLYLHFSGYQVLFLQGYSDWGMRLTTHIHLLLRQGMSGPVLPLPLNAIMVCRGATLHLCFRLRFYYVKVPLYHKFIITQNER